VLFHRKPEANTWGILNVREEFAKENPDAVARVLKVYEQARKWSLANPREVTKALAAAAKIPENVAEKQLKERTELTHSAIGKPQYESILAAGLALQNAGVVAKDVDVKKTLDNLIDTRFNAALTN
jgi:sulfonate transport system substrate-binding protein